MADGKPLIRVAFYEPYPMGLGGNFVTQRLILEKLDRARFHPIVVAPIEGVTLQRFRTMGVECVVIPPPGSLAAYGGTALRANPFMRLKSILDLVRYNLEMARFIRSRDIHILYANCVRAQLLAGLGAWLAATPSILYVKSQLQHPILDCICFLLASKILFLSRLNRDDRYPFLIRWLRKKIDIVEIGLDPMAVSGALRGDHACLRDELDISPDRFNVAILAQLYPPKGQHFAIQALGKLVREFPRLRMYLIGDHVLEDYRTYRQELEGLVARDGLSQHVRFTGWRTDPLEIVSLMDLIIHPSLAEGFGFSVLEAMALGKPVIASAVGGLREAIQDGHNGFLVPAGDVDAIVRRWRELLENAELRRRIGDEARRTVLRDYLADDKVSRLEDIWADIHAGRA